MGPKHSRTAVRAGAAALLAWHAAPALCAHSPALCRSLGVRRHGEDRAAVALTFDDGPDPRGTPAVLGALAAEGITATFFLVGEQVRDAPALAAEVAAAGHEIALHCDRHRNLLRLTPAQVRDDLLRARATIGEATGAEPRLYRPPYGVLSGAALTVARRHGWEPVLWDRWGRDWRCRATAASIVADAADALDGGEVLLLHDADRYSYPGAWRATAAALPALAARVRAAGLAFGPVR
jgi:peptidoglycan/xylan/chitin deacetylase (PgdA/CDA1 family)